MSDSTLWYISRGTGLVSLMLLTLVVVLGVLTRGGRPLPGLPRFAVAGLHRNAALLALTFLVIHVVTIVSDVYARVGWLDVFVPFISNFRALWVGLGTIGFELFIAVIATSMLRPWIGLRTWRAVHWAVYAAWPIGIAHAFGTGRDIGKSWMIAITALCIATVVGAVAWRIADAARGRSDPYDGSARASLPASSSAGRVSATELV
jgi:sulfoxide reductase heme-binding subunit YedZ